MHFKSRSTSFRELLEENAFRLIHSNNLSQLIPFIHKEEHTSIKSNMYGKETVIFDGTTHIFEAMVIVVCFVDEKTGICSNKLRG